MLGREDVNAVNVTPVRGDALRELDDDPHRIRTVKDVDAMAGAGGGEGGGGCERTGWSP